VDVQIVRNIYQLFNQYIGGAPATPDMLDVLDYIVKQQLRANMDLQEVGAARAEISQGISGIGSAFGNLAGSGIFEGGGRKNKNPKTNQNNYGTDGLGNQLNEVPGIE
jgi:hypothetical protein